MQNLITITLTTVVGVLCFLVYIASVSQLEVQGDQSMCNKSYDDKVVYIKKVSVYYISL